MGKFRVILASVLLIVLLAGCGETTTVPTTGAVSAATALPTKRTSISQEELNYPSAKKLSEKDLFPDGTPAGFKNDLFGAFINTDNQAQILDFYFKRLATLGLKPEPGYGCMEPGTCQKIYQLDGDIMECTQDKRACASTYQVSFLLVDRTATQEDDNNHNIPANLYTLAKSGQTLVVYRGGPYRPFTPPPANPTTAAAVENSLTPTVDK